ncbi:hypothetical protein VNO78_13258 [Psophocarpus tetragonolobus]|uniref:BHLH domain-containing protein n=1 Tax=Psophocarpus tetragonolobus TaxID=3891 RepID=A0AAN9XPW7_PSOTE
MALSTYFNCDTLQIPNLETNTFHEVMPEVATPNLQHLFSYSDESFFLSNVLLENYLEPGFLSPQLSPQENHPPYYDPFISLTHHDMLPTCEDHNLLPCLKRKRCSFEEQQHWHSSLQEFTTPTVPMSNLLGGLVVPYENCCNLQAEEMLQQLPQHGGTCDLQCEKKVVAERIISPQSLAARERRRKITEKTVELGKLVPGGPKLNTAEMLNAAARYVKYLQAQIGMLELMNTLKENEAAPPSEILQTLIASSFVQEKLYTEEMCFVPKETVITLTNHEDVQSRPSLLEDLKQLIETDIEKKAKPE